MTTVAGPRRARVARWPAAAAVVVGVLVAGCSSSGGSSKPAYCTAADQLKTSVDALGNVDVAKNGLNSLTTALKNVQTDATTFANEAKSAFAPQTTALKQSLTSLDAAITSAQGQSVATVAKTVAAPLAQVKNSASQLLSATKGKCS
jgi:hypothetical protein